ncbi:MAG: protein-disulfide reductase DsbD N-terminal domain-containing protein, partial [Gammaproteobacteria bacterium]
MIRARFFKALSSALLFISTVSFAAQEVKKPEEVFVYDAYGEESWIVVDWEIEDGYYLYRDKMGFAVDEPGITLGEPQLPPGEIYEDEF